MSPHNSTRVGAATCSAVLLMLAFVCRDTVAAADEPALSEGDLRKAEKVLTKLRLLYEAADAEDADAYRGLSSKFYPELFIKVAELRPGDLSTDLSTAVFLAEQLGRNWSAAGATAADCPGARPDIYQPLCAGLRGGTVRQLLLAKSRLHARWAEAVLRDGMGGTDAETTRTLAEVREARANDQLIAALVLKTLRTLEGLPQTNKPSPAEVAEALSEVNTLLAWMPRSPTFYHLMNARDAYRDGLWWHDKARQAKSLVVSAKSFAPDSLKDLRLDAKQVIDAAAANWMSAGKQMRLAELSLSQPTR